MQTLLSDGLVRTNPVLAATRWLDRHWDHSNSENSQQQFADCLRRWQDAGVAIPGHAMEDFSRDAFLPRDPSIDGRVSEPRVVGLLVSEDHQSGYVLPLAMPVQNHSAFLPFGPADVRSLLIQLSECFGASTASLPERLLLRFDESLRQDARGNSMHIAAMLRAVDYLSGESVAQFACACAVVEPRVDGRLVPVREVETKVAAFLREYKRGSLLVCAEECEISRRFENSFDEVWRVSSLQDLVDSYLRSVPSVYEVLAAPAKLQIREVIQLLSYLREEEESAMHMNIIRTCQRADKCGYAENVSVLRRTQVMKHQADALRHLGRYGESQDICDSIATAWAELPDTIVSDNEKLSLAVDHAAAMIDTCDFQAGLVKLNQWLDLAENDPGRFAADRRVELFNTAGRLMILLEIDQWDAMFGRSKRIQNHSDPLSVSRTESYQLHGLLRDGHLDRAEALLTKLEGLKLPGIAGGFTFFFRVEFDRRSELTTQNPRLSEDRNCYTHAFALSAAARQTGRTSEEVAELCNRSITILSEKIRDGVCGDGLAEDQNLLNLIRSGITLRSAAAASDEWQWSAAKQDARGHISNLPAGAQAWFSESLTQLDNSCDIAAAENFLSRLPYL